MSFDSRYSQEMALNHLSCWITTKPENVKNGIKCLRLKLSEELLDNAAVYQRLVVSSDINSTEEAEYLKGDNCFYFSSFTHSLLQLSSDWFMFVSMHRETCMHLNVFTPCHREHIESES